MNSSRDPELLMKAFLEDGINELPDRSYDAVRADIERTRQRVVLGPWREELVSRYAIFGVAAAAVVLIAVVGFQLLPSNGTLFGPGTTPSPAPTATPAPTPTPIPLIDSGPLEPATYVVHPFTNANESTSVTFTVPSGWETEVSPAGQFSVIAPVTGYSGPNGMSLGFVMARTLEADPCRWTPGASSDVAVGATREELAAALIANGGYVATATSATVGGLESTRVDVEIPADLNLTDCRDGQFWIWGDGADGAAIYSQGPGGRFHFWIVETAGEVVIVQTHDFPGTPPDTVAEAESIVASMFIQTLTESSTESGGPD